MGPTPWSDGNPDVARRTFSDLRESNWSSALNYKWTIGEGAEAPSIKVGGLYRETTRDAFNRQFSILSSHVPDADRARRAEELLRRTILLGRRRRLLDLQRRRGW